MGVKRAWCVSLVIGIWTAGCATFGAKPGETPRDPASPHASVLQQNVTLLVAQMAPTEANTVAGKVTFTRLEDGRVRVQADLRGFAPGSVHGFHIHEYGDCSAPDGTSAGGHYAPRGNRHGLPPEPERHAGDLGNIQADATGAAGYERVVDNISLTEGESPIVGRGVIIHARRDTGEQPAGNAGARLACGVIGVAERFPEASR